MGRTGTTAAIAVLLACVTACSPADSETTRAGSSTTAVPLAPALPSQVQVDPGREYTTITGIDGERARLAGRFEFDAQSTDGTLLYLIEHRPPPGSENYRVRVYDFDADELRREPIADKRNLHTDMTGRPMARVTSADGVWVFTLYRGADHAFVHSLNVDEAYSLCLDLPHGSQHGSGDWSLALTRDGDTLRAVAGSTADRVEFDLREELAE